MEFSKNKYAYEIVKSKFFENIENINQLICKINKGYNFNNRGIEGTKGDIFEIFCEAYLKTNPEYQIKNVYPQGYVPSSLRKKLKLSYQDRGYDGVYETNDGEFSTYQSKFRSNDEQLTWQGKNGLSSFIGVSEKAHTRHLIATTNKVSKEFLSKSRIQLTLLSDLRKLNKNDFDRISNFLNNKKIEIKKHQPEKYQRIAIEKVIKTLKTDNRTTIIMACGTGKTEVGLWVYEKIKPKICLVLVPSIALVKQIRGAWLSQMNNKVMTYQLCSSKDVTKQEDHIQVKKTDLDMKFYSDVKNLKRWINTKKKIPKIIFSTYQSSKLLKNVFKKDKPIDFAVFDEAHRTAILNSKVDSYFSFALHDKNIPIKKRLFMTATRRVSSQSKFRAVGSPYLNISMDNKNLYGNICYNLSFYKAAKKYNAIAKPRIIISEVFSDEVDAEKRKFSSTHFKGIKLKSDYLALIIAIKKAIQKYKIKKIFSFHRTVNDAKIFADPNIPESIKSHLKDFFTNYVSGSMNMRKRDDIMDEFILSKKGFISNARCLVEGVNVPSVDMISFTHQKESEVDIVQAIGRALRNRNQNKKFGYVLVPIFVERNKNENIEQALDRTNFKKVIILLKALREHDTEIAQIIDEILINEGRGKGFSLKNRKKISDLIETVTPEIKKKVLIKSIHSKVIENLRLKWDLMIGKLLDFKKKYNHFNVGYKDEEFKDLRYWVSDVRKLYQQNKLYNFQIEQLSKLGFSLQEPGINQFDENKFYTASQLGKKFLNKKTVYQLINKKKLKPIGKAFVIGEGPVDVYKRYSEKEFVKQIGIDFLPKKNLVSSSQLANHLGIDRGNIPKLVKEKKLKAVGRTIVPGASGIRSVFKLLSKKEFNKKIGVTIDNPGKKFVTLSKLTKLIFEGKKNKVGILKLAIKEKKLKPSGYAMTSGAPGVVEMYKKITKKELKKILKVDFFEYGDYLPIKKLAKHLNIGLGLLKSLKRKKIINPVGISTGPTRSGRIELYKKISQKEFLKITGVNFINRNDLYNFSSFAKKMKLSQPSLKKLVDNKIILPEGKTFISNKTKPFYVYKLIKRHELLSLLKKNKKIFPYFKKLSLYKKFLNNT